MVFANAHYRHANTETIVGHATLATGTHPSVHGMTGNVWYDAEAAELSYNIEDPDSPILPVREEQQSGDQVDPAQKLSRTSGRSPESLLAETLADKLLAYSAGKSRAFAVSGKDRSAVALAGKGGKAFWMSTDSGDFVTSAWYYDDYPEWVAGWNAERKASQLAGTQWRLLHAQDSYLLAGQDDRPYETDLRGFGRTFPHRYGEAGNKLLYTQVVASPASLECEDMVLQLDRTLAGLLSYIDELVGLDKTLVVLSADHGIAEMPEYLAERGFETGRLTPEAILEAANRVSRERFGTDGLIRFYYRPYLYLDQERISGAGLNPEQVREELAQALTLELGIHIAATRLMLEGWPDRKLFEKIRNNYHPVRSGDIYIVQEPYWFNFDKGPVADMHGSPWNYDTHVPVIFAGPGINVATVHRQIQPADVAPTLAALLKMSPPASAQGEILPEVFAESAVY